jgi:hypothetical protein
MADDLSIMSQMDFSVWEYSWNSMHHLLWWIMCISSCYWKLGYLLWSLLSFGYRNALDATSIRHENTTVDDSTQQASSFQSNRGKLYVLQNWMLWFAILNALVCTWCTMLKSILLNPVQQNRMFRNQKSEGPVFPKVRMIWAKQWWMNLRIGGHPSYVV